jgi:hypothetical protein
MTIPRFRFTALSLSISAITASCAPPESSRASGDARCEFSDVESLGVVNSPAFDGSPTVSADETELFFTSERTGLQDLFVSTRPSKEAAWGQPVNLGAPIDDPAAGDFSLRLSNDGTALYFASTRSGGHGKADISAETSRATPRPEPPTGPAARSPSRRKRRRVR